MHISQECSALLLRLLCWLLSCAAREMHTYTLVSYVILGKAALLTAPGLVVLAWLGLKSSPVAWVDGLGIILYVQKFEKVKFTTFLTP